MKKSKTVAWVFIMGLLLAGCATSPTDQGQNWTFREASSANVVLQFSSWDYIFIVKPRYEDNGFLRQVRRDDVGQVFNDINIRREMAVVVIGYMYGTEDQYRILTDWKAILTNCGFHRVVFVRSDNADKLNGAQIVEDSNLSMEAAQAAAAYQSVGQ